MRYNMTRAEVEAQGEVTRNFGPPKKTKTVSVLREFKLVMHPLDQSLTPAISDHGFWESWITAWMTRWLRPGMRFIDVGANAGYYSMLAEGLVGKYGTVYAVEPNPVYVDLLKQTKKLNKARFEIIPFALADSLDIGAADLAIPDNLHGSASIVGGFPDHDVETVSVIVSTLDEEFFNTDEDLVPTIIKIDAEGAEEKVWHGGQKFLNESEGHITLVLEWTPKAYSEKFLEELDAWGNVSLLNYAGMEEPTTQEQLDEAPDWQTIVVRRR